CSVRLETVRCVTHLSLLIIAKESYCVDVSTPHRRTTMSSKAINMNFDEMGKKELRAACKAAGISYAKLNNGGMRAALKAAHPEPEVATVQETPAPLVLTAV